MELSFKNPSNGYVEVISKYTWFWCLLFGLFYFLYKGIWSHTIIGFILAFITSGISWFIYPFFAKKILINSYLKAGWIDVTNYSVFPPKPE